MKAKIKFIPSLIANSGFWQVTINGNTTNYEESAAAYEYARKKLKRVFKEQAAFSRVSKVSVNLLSIDEAKFIRKMIKSKCAGITKAQYGFLAGIYERQEREW
jgi:hypothetical protein